MILSILFSTFTAVTELSAIMQTQLIEKVNDSPPGRREQLRTVLATCVQNCDITNDMVWASMFRAMGIEADYEGIVARFNSEEFGLAERVQLKNRLESFSITEVVLSPAHEEGRDGSV